MATAKSFADFIVDQLDALEGVVTKKMFGEYALYYQGKVVALLCDNCLYVKVTEGGRAFVGQPKLAPAYPGAKPSMLIEESLEDRDFLTELIRTTQAELPPVAPKKPKAKRPKTSLG